MKRIDRSMVLRLLSRERTVADRFYDFDVLNDEVDEVVADAATMHAWRSNTYRSKSFYNKTT